jgi:hypothetical protein
MIKSPEEAIEVVSSDLVPTQMTVGMREVNFKRLRWRERSNVEAKNYLSKLRIPVVLGPDGRRYLIDRHHLTLALRKEGICEVTVLAVANLSTLSFTEFWTVLDRQHWTHPFDEEGRRRCYSDLPQCIDDLRDDPFRSLAGSIRRAGVYSKDEAPFSEFKWAAFLRRRIPRAMLERDFCDALSLGLRLAEGAEAMELPGWRPPHLAKDSVRIAVPSPGLFGSRDELLRFQMQTIRNLSLHRNNQADGNLSPLVV